MNTLQIFENAAFGQIRTLEQDGQLWFIGKDVAEILGYSNTRDVLSKKVDEEDKGVANCDTPSGTQQMTIINESGLYSLIFASKLPTAKQFKHWVTNEVLPTIRKTGQYSSKPLCIEDILIQSLQATKEIRQSVERANNRIDDICGVITLNPNEWRENSRKLIAKIAQRKGGFEYIEGLQIEIYQIVEERAGVNLSVRLTNKLNRLINNGVCKSKRDKVTKVDVIADDKRLIEIYVAVVKEMAIKNGIGVS